MHSPGMRHICCKYCGGMALHSHLLDGRHEACWCGSICLWGLEITQLHVVEQVCCNTHHILVEVTFTHASAFINAGAILHADAFHLWSCRPAEVEVVHARMIKVVGVRMTEKRWPI